MELQHLTELWKSADTQPAPTSQAKLAHMLTAKTHPVLQKIKRQLILEMLAWAAIIAFYYSAFDGHLRPPAINLIFITGFLQAIGYNLTSYLAASKLIQGENLTLSISMYAHTLKKLRWTAICSRTVLMLCFIVFFSYDLELNAKRLLSIGAIGLVFSLQLVWIYRHWSARIAALQGIIRSIDGTLS